MADFEQMRLAVGHDPCRASDRWPLGAVPAGTATRLVLRVHEVARASLRSASMLVSKLGTPENTESPWAEVGLEACGEGYAAMLYFATPGVTLYAFRLSFHDGAEAYLVPCANSRTTASQLVVPGIDGEWTERGWAFAKESESEPLQDAFALADPAPGFQVTVYEPQFRTPEWMNGAIMYQIFPDRFSRGDNGPCKAGVKHHAIMKRPLHLHGNWDEAVEWGTKDYDPIDFFGGTLEGIRQKLDYLRSLGVEVLYLNPIFEARSNHRYDTADYEHIDALLGSDDDFKKLADDAAKLGISIILDAVLSHTGDDSRYFNALETYDEPGASQGAHSPFYPWFDFEDESSEVGYRCWWGFPALPEVDERNSAWQDYILGEEGILARWLNAGAQGYRLDVADEIPDDVLEKIRARVKATKGNAGIIGEVWEDATTKESYGEPRTYALGGSLDSVMNYPLRTALLGFALGSIDAYQLSTFLRLQQSNYPAPLYSCLMNLLSTHDVERIRSVLALGKPLEQLSRKEQLAATSKITAAQDCKGACLQRLVVALLYALPGMPCVYYGDEYGMQGGGDPFCRATLPQNDEAAAARTDCGQNLVEFYRTAGSIRKSSPALRSGAFACVAPSSDVLCLVRTNLEEGSFIVAAANRSDARQAVAFDAYAPDFDVPPAVRAALKSAGVIGAPSFSSAGASSTQTGIVLKYENGIVQLEVPPCATVYWSFPPTASE